jgi:hypothetical protein
MASVKNNKKTERTTAPAHQPSINVNPKLPNLWVDGLNVAAREDDICVLRFFTTLPEGVFEQSRVITHKEKLRNFVDAICENLGYYPTEKTKAKVKREVH